ncbi:MAG: hypothetical protein ACT4OO_12095 [Nitrospiraceae bacterium]
MANENLNWTVQQLHPKRENRTAHMRSIDYEVVGKASQQSPAKNGFRSKGKALSINRSAGGMLLMMEGSPQVRQQFQVEEDSPSQARAARAEVRWIKSVPLPPKSNLHFVGIKFLPKS